MAPAPNTSLPRRSTRTQGTSAAETLDAPAPRSSASAAQQSAAFLNALMAQASAEAAVADPATGPASSSPELQRVPKKRANGASDDSSAPKPGAQRRLVRSAPRDAWAVELSDGGDGPGRQVKVRKLTQPLLPADMSPRKRRVKRGARVEEGAGAEGGGDVSALVVEEGEEVGRDVVQMADEVLEAPPPKKRGRPRKTTSVGRVPTGRPRGRPRKSVPAQAEEVVDPAAAQSEHEVPGEEAGSAAVEERHPGDASDLFVVEEEEEETDPEESGEAAIADEQRHESVPAAAAAEPNGHGLRPKRRSTRNQEPQSPAHDNDADVDSNSSSVDDAWDEYLLNEAQNLQSACALAKAAIRKGLRAGRTAKSRKAKAALEEIRGLMDSATDLNTSNQNADASLDTRIEHVAAAVDEISASETWATKRTVKDIYWHVLPHLTLLLKALLSHLRSASSPDSTTTTISHAHLKTITPIFECAIVLAEAAQDALPKYNNETSPTPTQPPILPHLDAIYSAFSTEVSRLERAQETARRHATTLRRMKAQTQRRDREARRAKALRAWKQRWADLHAERFRAEFGGRLFWTRADEERLRMVALGEEEQGAGEGGEVEVDGDGVAMERVEVFGRRRRTRTPGVYVRGVRWWGDEEHIYALERGLRTFAGDRVYERIFEAYCKPGQALQRYSVTEIVDQAMLLCAMVIEDDRAEGRTIEDWLEQIYDPRLPPSLEELDE